MRYQVFYRMNITEFHPFAAGFESSERILIKPDEVAHYHKGWHSTFEEIIKDAQSRCSHENQKVVE